MSDQDYINLTKAIGSFGWKDTPNMVYFWIRIIFMANTEDTDWHGMVIKRGSFVTTVSSLSEELRLSVKQVRTCIERLKKGKYVGTSTANNKHIITICDFDSYLYDGANEGQIEGKCLANEKKNPPSLMVPNGSSPNNPSSFTPLLFPQEEIEEGDTVVSPKKETIDFDFIMDSWNKSMKRKVPKIKTLAETRKEKIRLRVAEMGGWESAKVIIEECFRKINESEYCNGENNQVWVATFDWFFINDKNWLKVYEGNYDNRQRKTRLEQYAELAQKGHEYYSSQRYGYGKSNPFGDPQSGRDNGPDEQ